MRQFFCILWTWPRCPVDLKPDPESNPRVEDEWTSAAEVNARERRVLSG
jgi:hypothetical protein